MNKRFLGFLLAFALVMSQTLFVFAAPSAQLPSGGNYGDNFTDVIKDDNALKVIDYINNTNPSNAEAIQVINEYTGLNLDGGVLLTDFYKLDDVQMISEDGMYVFSLEVLNLPNNAKARNVRGIMFYNAEKGWGMATPIALQDKTLTFKVPYIPSAIAIYLPTTQETTSPVTGVTASCGLAMSVAAVASVVSAVAHKKSKEN